MKLLLDLHKWLWMLAEPERLTANVRSLLADTDKSIFVSVASVWEIRIKHALGKISLPLSFEALVAVSKERFNTKFLVIEVAHAMAAPGLPMHHRDPFDRMLVAQALAKDLTLVTADDTLKKYECAIIPAT